MLVVLVFYNIFQNFASFQSLWKSKRLDVIIYRHANKTLGLLQYDQHILLLVLKPDILNIKCLHVEEKLVHDVPPTYFFMGYFDFTCQYAILSELDTWSNVPLSKPNFIVYYESL